MNPEYMGQGGIRRQLLLNGPDIVGGVLGPFQKIVRAGMVITYTRHAFSICAVYQDQRLPVRGQKRADGGFHREGAAALHGHADVIVTAARNGDQLFPDPRVDGDELVVTGAEVMQHRLLHAE